MVLPWRTYIFAVFLFVGMVCLGEASVLPPPEAVENPNGICGIFVLSQGYNCQEFKLPTGDGFLLGVQRVRSKSIKPVKGPIFLYHGIMQGGDIWVLNGPKNSLAFILADTGYDVWIGSTRSSRFSYGHVTYDRSDQEFWDWSWDDLVAQDLRSMLHFVALQSQQPIIYVGYSQGAMSAFAAFTQSETAQLIKKAAMLSPVGYLNHASSPVASIAAWLFLDKVLLVAGIHEFNLTNAGGKQLIDSVCHHIKLRNCYSQLLNLVTGPNCCLNSSRLSFYHKYELQSTSMRNLAQMAQLLRSGRFGKYDYGWFRNLFHYGDLFPPSYDLSAIPGNLPILLAYGGKDGLADAEDVKHLLEDLQGETQILFVPDYAHGDFVLGTSATTVVYNKLLLFFDQGV